MDATSWYTPQWLDPKKMHGFPSSKSDRFHVGPIFRPEVFQMVHPENQLLGIRRFFLRKPIHFQLGVENENGHQFCWKISSFGIWSQHGVPLCCRRSDGHESARPTGLCSHKHCKIWVHAYCESPRRMTCEWFRRDSWCINNFPSPHSICFFKIKIGQVSAKWKPSTELQACTEKSQQVTVGHKLFKRWNNLSRYFQK